MSVVGVIVIPRRVLDDTRMTPAALRVLLAIGCYADKSGWCFPKQATIAEDLGVTRQAVQKQMSLLVEWGYLVKGDQLAPGRSNRWRVVFDAELADVHSRAVQPVVASGCNQRPHLMQPLEVAPDATSGGCTERTNQRTNQLTMPSPNGNGGSAPSEQKARPRNALWDALTSVFGETTNTAEASRRGKVVKLLKESGAQPDEIDLRRREWRRVFPGATCTEMALANHWSELTPRPYFPDPCGSYFE